ncbi:LytTR family transcriptional regulator DNA-binding domain-containing protein [Advenella mimigardefordensis]|uniref:Putative regulator protein n=1 Tax=Advenella mimigardefordensis (strain DSM 17166 / LMG 22922 / DPN7) TaxID=1247726 RepID=W0P9J8_ADVMD|nr:LytTR family transcriptional regulator DNA-binding domain-containing protein [Advenella mimigardefordensis]AHG62167.1 putative regulator protein [Advenella mimigardefordensis DPN7]
MKTAGNYEIHTPTDKTNSLAEWPYQCARHLLTYPIDTAISKQLAFMGEAIGADRAWMLEYRPDMLRFRNTHEWCRGQTEPFVAQLQEAPTTLIAWLHQYMKKGQAVMLHDVEHLPGTAKTLQIEFRRQGNKSVLNVPVCHNNNLFGIIGFDTTVSHKVWSTAEVQALYQCANLIGQARFSQRQHQRESAELPGATQVIYLSTRGIVRGVSPDNIVGVRSAGNYSEVWLEDGAMVLDSRALGVWETLLPPRTFFRIHRTAIINALQVMEVDRRQLDKWQIQLRSVASAWPVSRSYRKPLRERMGI